MKLYIILLGVLILGLIAGGIYMNRESITIEDLLGFFLPSISAQQTSYYNTSNTTSTTAWKSGGASTSNMFAAGTQATVGEYNLMRTINQSNASVKSGGSNFEPFWRFNFTINEPETTILWLKADFTGNENGSTEVGTVYIYNFTSALWITIAAMNGTNSNVSINVSGTDVINFVGGVGVNQTLLVFEGANFDAADGDWLYVDYAGLTIEQILQDTTAPQWANNSISGTQIGTNVTHSINWIDAQALSGYIFEFDNGSGTFVNDTFVTFTGTQNFSNVVKSVNTTVGSTIRWRVYANDSSNNLNSTNIFSYTASFISFRNYSIANSVGVNIVSPEPNNSQENDIFVAIFVSETAAIQSLPSGWTQLYSPTPPQNDVLVGYIRRGASAPNLTFSTGGANVYSNVIISAYSGVIKVGSPIDNQSASGATGSGTTAVNPNPPSVIAITNYTMAVAGGTRWNGGFTGAPSGYSHFIGGEGALADKTLSTNGTEDPGFFISDGGDTAGYWNGFTITLTPSIDAESPKWSSNSTNGTDAGTLINHTVVWTDDYALANYTFSFDNGTGTFVNDSSVSMTGTSNQSSTIKFVNQSVGSTIRWRVWAWDLTGNNNLTSIFAYNVTAPVTDSCTYTSGNWDVQCVDNCSITTGVDLNNNNITLNGTGTFNVRANITGFRQLIKDNKCYLDKPSQFEMVKKN